MSSVAGLKTLTRPPENLFRVETCMILWVVYPIARALNIATNNRKRVN
jgi:hypothetical protein